MYQIIQKRKISLTISSLLVIASIIALIVFGLNFGIDFTGGSLLEVKFNNERPSVADTQSAISDLDLGSLLVQPVGDEGMILRFRDIDEDTHQKILKRLDSITQKHPPASTSEAIRAGKNTENTKTQNIQSENSDSEGQIEDEIIEVEIEGATGTGSIEIETEEKKLLTNLEELRFDSVGPSIGEELKRKSFNAAILVLIAIVLYIAWVFRKVSKPVASWKYGISAIIALFHDIMIVLGIFAVLGEYLNVEINTPFVAAILTVLGYSVNDTIVVFDRVRENLPKSEEDFEGTVNTSVNQTIRRSINTSVTTLLVLLSILFFGGSTIRDFVLALSIGVLIGTYSSIFLASPVLVVWEKLMKRNT